MSESSVCFPNSEYIDKYNVQYFKENPDYHNPKFNTKFGVYSEGCGLDNVLMSWGHDDYMYLVSAGIIQTTEQFFEHPAPAAAVFLNVQIVSFSPSQVAKENKTTLPSAGLFIIRYHSFYRKLAPDNLFVASYRSSFLERQKEREIIIGY